VTLYLRDFHLSSHGDKVYNVFSDDSASFGQDVKDWMDARGIDSTTYMVWFPYLSTKGLVTQGLLSGGALTFIDSDAEMLFKLSIAPVPT
jgi:hypothetical protein